MADRTVTTTLVLKIRDYVANAREAKTATHGVTEGVVNASKASDKLTAATTVAGKSTVQLGDKMRDTAMQARKLDGDIENLGRQILVLKTQMATADDDMFNDLDVKLRGLEQKLSRKLNVRKAFADAGGDGAQGLVAGLFAKAGPLVARMPLGPWMLPAAAAAGPLIGASLTAGIVGGVSGAAVAGGVAVALRDERVQAEVDAFGQRLNSELDDAFSDFVPAVIGGFNIFHHELTELKPQLQEIGALSAKMVAPLARGGAAFLSGVTPGALATLEKAPPLIRQIESVMGQLGRSSGFALKTIASGAEGAALALSDMATTADLALRLTAVGVRQLTFGYQVSIPPLGRMILGWLDGGEAAGGFTDQLGAMAREMQQAQEQSALMASAQHRLEEAFIGVAPQAGRLSSLVDGLRKASDLMYGATIRAADANQAWQASWDSLSESVKSNGRSLNIHTAAGRSNRDMLKDLAQRNNDLFFANIEAGMSIEQATRKHQARIVKIKEEARQLGLNKTETAKLIATYGRIPKAKSTDLLLEGVNRIVDALLDLYLWQRALATGQTIGQVRGGAQGNVSRFKAAGGRIEGHSPSDTADNIPIWATAEEWVIRRPSARKMQRTHPGALDHINRYGELPGYASGGLVAPIDTSRRWPFEIDVNRSRIPSRKEVAAKVAPSFGRWPSSPGAQRGDSGIWRQILRFVRNAGIPYRVSSTYRRGDPLWHGSGRAVDFGGYNQDRLAGFFMRHQSKMLELIHRSGGRDYGVSRGRRHYMGEGLLNAHRDHVHAAMRFGGPVAQPSTSTHHVTNHFHNTFTINGANQNLRAIADEVSRIVGRQADLYARGG